RAPEIVPAVSGQNVVAVLLLGNDFFRAPAGAQEQGQERDEQSHQSLTAAQTISSTRRRPSSPPSEPSWKGVRGIGFQPSRAPSYLKFCGIPVSSSLYCPSLPPIL